MKKDLINLFRAYYRINIIIIIIITITFRISTMTIISICPGVIALDIQVHIREGPMSQNIATSHLHTQLLNVFPIAFQGLILKIYLFTHKAALLTLKILHLLQLFFISHHHLEIIQEKAISEAVLLACWIVIHIKIILSIRILLTKIWSALIKIQSYFKILRRIIAEVVVELI